MKEVDVCVIGGGAAGISACLGAAEGGAKHIVLIERDIELGGILQQCIHNGFGLHHFKEELTGPSYAEKIKNQLLETHTEIKLETTVLSITRNHKVTYTNEKEGYQIMYAKAIILAVGSRERTRYQIDLPGKRIAGIMTAGVAQRYLNLDGYLVGKKVFILGSGDIGLIMARRMTLEGAKVLAVAEIMPYSNGLNRNIVQCLEDYNIPLYLNHTVIHVSGKKRLEEITIAEVDDAFKVKAGTEKDFLVDTLLLSVGLIPEIKLLKDINVETHPTTNGALVDDHYQTSIPGIFVCGNALHIHDLVDYVSEEGYEAGKYATSYALTKHKAHPQLMIKAEGEVRYVIPNKLILNNEDVTVKFRVKKPLNKGKILIKIGDKILKKKIKTYLLPAEMEQIVLPIKDINISDGDEISIIVEGGD